MENIDLFDCWDQSSFQHLSFYGDDAKFQKIGWKSPSHCEKSLGNEQLQIHLRFSRRLLKERVADP